MLENEKKKKRLAKITREDVMTKGLCMSVQGWIFPFLFRIVIFPLLFYYYFFILSSNRVEVIVAHRRRFLGVIGSPWLNKSDIKYPPFPTNFLTHLTRMKRDTLGGLFFLFFFFNSTFIIVYNIILKEIRCSDYVHLCTFIYGSYIL